MFRREENKKLCEDILHDIAKRHHITITEMSVSQAFHLLKGASARELFKQKPNFRQRYSQGHFWSPGKFYRTIGDADAETVIHYVREHQFQQTILDVFPTTTKHAY